MNEVGFFDTFPLNNNAQFNGVWSVYPLLNSGTIIASDIDRGLFLLRLDPTLSNPEVSQAQFTISPNPARSEVTITSETIVDKIEIVDVLGKTITTKNGIFESNFTLDVSNLQSGLYFIKLNNSTVQKILIE